jgi:hypothetical protein
MWMGRRIPPRRTETLVSLTPLAFRLGVLLASLGSRPSLLLPLGRLPAP